MPFSQNNKESTHQYKVLLKNNIAIKMRAFIQDLALIYR